MKLMQEGVELGLMPCEETSDDSHGFLRVLCVASARR